MSVNRSRLLWGSRHSPCVIWLTQFISNRLRMRRFAVIERILRGGRWIAQNADRVRLSVRAEMSGNREEIRFPEQGRAALAGGTCRPGRGRWGSGPREDPTEGALDAQQVDVAAGGRRGAAVPAPLDSPRMRVHLRRRSLVRARVDRSES